MRKISLFLGLFIALIIFLSACDESNEEKVFISDTGSKIEFGQICGWCHGQEQMTITESGYSYEYDYACGDSLDIDEQKFETTAELWSKLTSLVDLEEFSQLDINTCAYCADGCDYWLILKDTAYSHEIRFTSADSISHGPTSDLAKELIQLLEAKRQELGAF